MNFTGPSLGVAFSIRHEQQDFVILNTKLDKACELQCSEINPMAVYRSAVSFVSCYEYVLLCIHCDQRQIQDWKRGSHSSKNGCGQQVSIVNDTALIPHGTWVWE